ncbi:cysteine hydrolase [Neorhizobium sp. T786]|uniref:cysteine hydrolase family protein n=1 Tax=Pseudorhizobium xiangyangii TaxID=2883104 RepID=UPI001D0005A0|nr:cysteine hydrolase [Neorhizobium xiangyangii]MCB5203754.1 cysteine hydrolase [Neorhizobium xiangyangii]
MSPPNWRHLCIDMQRMFNEDTPWHVDWMNAVLPMIDEVAGRFPSETVFTRFVPPHHASQATGAWRDYYENWGSMTLDRLPYEMIDVVDPLRKHIPPARVFDKATYSPWVDGRLHLMLIEEKVSSIVVSGGETDVCVLATVLGAIDLGYHVTVLSNAVCSGTDETHDAALTLLRDRFSIQLDVTTVEAFLRTAN